MRGRTTGVLFLLLICCAADAPALAGVSASLDSSQIASGDTVQLTLEHDGSTSGQPDLTPLQKDFDILGTSSSTSFELINGSASEKTAVILTLAPKVAGRLTIPAISWDGQQSQPLALEVTGPGGSGQAGASGAAIAAKVFIETTAAPVQPYVEAAVRLTVRLFTSETLYHGDLQLPENSNVVVKQIGSDEDSDVERDGRTYQVVTRQYLLFPLHSGKLTLQGPVLDAEVAVGESRSSSGNSSFGGFFGGRLFSGVLRTIRPVRVRGKPIVLAVHSRPPGALASYWLPARNVTLSAVWNPANLTVRAGDPVTLDLDLQASGLTAAQLPDLSSLLRFPSGLKSYPDQASLNDSAQNGTLVGNRDQTIALMADAPGHYTIPALTVTWWDTQSNQPRTATVPARTLTILPAPGSAAAAGPPAATAQRQPIPTASRHPPPPPAAQQPATGRSPSKWEWISLGLGAVWLATLGAWMGSRRRARAGPPAVPGGSASRTREPARTLTAAAPLVPAKERAAFHAACAANDARAARAHLLAWTTALWGAAPAGVNAVAARIGDAHVAELLRDLDRACYAGGPWQGAPLAAALTELPALSGHASRGRHRLAPLYPEIPGPPHPSRTSTPADRVPSKRTR